MAQIKVLKIAADGLPLEHTASADDITMTSYTINGGGPVLSATGLNLNTTAVSGVTTATFANPTTGTINQTAGNLVIDNIMAKERANVITSAGSIQFGAVADTVGGLGSLLLPKLAGAPTAVPTAGEGSFVYDSTNDKLWLYTTAGWDDLSTVTSAANVEDTYTAAVILATNDAVYISAADNVSKAIASASTSSQVVGFAIAGVAALATVNVRKTGRMGGFTALTAGARYYLDGTTAGAISATVPTGAGHTIVQAGYAKNTTTLDIQIQNLGRRA